MHFFIECAVIDCKVDITKHITPAIENRGEASSNVSRETLLENPCSTEKFRVL